MPAFISKLFTLFRSLRVEASVSRRHIPMIEENNDQDAYLPPRIGTADGTTPKKPSARQRLDGLASYRIRSSAINFASGGPRGSGGNADVAQATFRRGIWRDVQVVAVKKIRYSQDTNQKKFSNEFVHEVEIMAGLSHENIVKLVGFVEDLENGKAWVVLPWEPNGNVSEFLTTRRWEIPERVSLLKDTFEGVKYLHTRQPPICHGDLKSFNILVSSSYRAIITDFGSARAIIESEVKLTDEELERQTPQNRTTEQANPQIDINAFGNQLTLTGPAWSLRWAPPEVVSGKRPGLSTDVWAAGWIAWEVMTDKVPFHEVNSAGAITLMVIKGEVPATREDAQLGQIILLCSLMKDCWTFNPKTRPNIERCCTGLQWIPSFLPSGGKASDRRAPSIDLLLELGRMYYSQRDLEKATSLYQQALSLGRSSSQEIGVAHALSYLGDVYRIQSNYTRAVDLYTQAQEIYARTGNDRGQANTLVGLGEAYRVQSQYTQAEESYNRAREIYARVDNDLGRASTLYALGHVSLAQSKYTQAEDSYTRAQEIYTRIGEAWGRGHTLLGMGDVYSVQSKYAQAEESYTRARETYTRIGDDLGRAHALRDLGNLLQKQGRNTEAALHYAEAKDLFAQIGSTRSEKDTAQRLAAVSQLHPDPNISFVIPPQ